MLRHILLMVTGTMSIGYLVHRWLYWRIMGAPVPLLNELCTGEDLVLSLVSAGFVMSWFADRTLPTNTPLHILLMMAVTTGVGYFVHVVLYRLEMHEWVDPMDDACSAIDLLMALGIAGFVTSWF